MEKLKVAVSANTSNCFTTGREIVDIHDTNFTEYLRRRYFRR